MTPARTVQCRHCGESNPLGRIFCRACGRRLDLEDAEEVSRRPARVRRSGTRRRLSGMLRVAGVLLLVVGAGGMALVFLPSGIRPEPVTARDQVTAVRRKLDRLEAALHSGKTAAVWFEESEINSYLAGLLAARRFRDPWPPFGQPAPESVAVRLSPQGYRALLRVVWGPLRTEWRLEGSIQATAEGVRVQWRKFAVGRMRLPAALGRRLVRRLAGFFPELERAARILENLLLIRWEQNRVLCGV